MLTERDLLSEFPYLQTLLTDPVLRSARQEFYVETRIGDLSFLAYTGKVGPFKIQEWMPFDTYETAAWNSERSPAISKSDLELVKKNPKWDRVILSRCGTGEVALLKAYAEKTGLVFKVRPQKIRVLSLVDSTWIKWSAGFSTSLKRNLQLASSRMSKDGITWVDTMTFPEISMVYEARTHHRAWSDYTSTQPFCGFMQRLMEGMMSEGRLRCVGLRQNGILKAFALGFVNQQRLYIFQHGHDPNLKIRSPGKVVMIELIKRTFAQDTDIKYVDFFTELDHVDSLRPAYFGYSM